MEQMETIEPSVIQQGIDQLETRTGSVAHRHSKGEVELDDRRRPPLEQQIVERHDPRPVGLPE
jgi:hypothetical protein